MEVRTTSQLIKNRVKLFKKPFTVKFNIVPNKLNRKYKF